MLITSIRHKVNSELDAYQSASFMRYLMHFLRMFAYLGIIFPILIGVDYYLEPLKTDETVINKYHEQSHYGNVIYRLYTDSHQFFPDNYLYTHTEKGDKITIHFTPIFSTVTFVSKEINSNVYMCNARSIYGVLIILVCLTFLFSIFLIIKTWGWIKKRKRIKFNIAVNVGIVNAFLCLMTLLAVLFHMPN